MGLSGIILSGRWALGGWEDSDSMDVMSIH